MKRDYDEIPIATQTMYIDLVERAWTGNIARLTSSGGTPYTREKNGRQYWYWRPATEFGKRPSPRYIGPDSEKTRERIAAMVDEATALRQRRDMVRSLRAARFPTPDARTGDVLAALAEAGVFRLGGVVVGTVAFQTYAGMLGVRLGATLGQTEDLDIGQSHSIAVAVHDKIDQNLEEVLKAVDKRFEAIPDAMDTRRTMRYAIRAGAEQIYGVDVLSPMRGPDRDKIGHLPALQSDAQFIRHLDFLLYQEQNSVVLHGAGIPINVPDPTRYALHKLIVSQMRRADNQRSARKAGKDLNQAEALIRVLAKQRPDDLTDLWQELCERGPSWREMALKSLAQMPVDISRALGETRTEESEDSPAP